MLSLRLVVVTSFTRAFPTLGTSYKYFPRLAVVTSFSRACIDCGYMFSHAWQNLQNFPALGSSFYTSLSPACIGSGLIILVFPHLEALAKFSACLAAVVKSLFVLVVTVFLAFGTSRKFYPWLGSSYKFYARTQLDIGG